MDVLKKSDVIKVKASSDRDNDDPVKCALDGKEGVVIEATDCKVCAIVGGRFRVVLLPTEAIKKSS